LPPEAPVVAPAVAPASTSAPVASLTPVDALVAAPVGDGAAAAPGSGPVAAVADLFSFKCPFCRADIEVSIDCVGDRINCPACHRAFVVPQVGQQAKPDFKPAAKAMAAAAEEQFVSFLCKSCGQEIEAPIDMAGSQDECPSCGA